MAAPIYNFSSHPEVTTLLSAIVEEQQWYRHVFAGFMSPPFYKYKTGKDIGAAGLEGQAFTGAPIEMQKAFIAEGGTEMLIPVRSRFIDPPIFGDQNGRGKGEAVKFATRTVQINKTMKVFSIPTGMEEQKLKRWKKLITATKDGASEWISDWTCNNIVNTMLNGFSTDLTHPVSGGGLAVDVISHPNFFIPDGTGGASQVGIDGTTKTYTASSRPGTAAYETAVTTAVNTLTNATTQGCTAAFISAIVKKANRLKIGRIMVKNTHPFYPIFLKDSAYDQLSNDPTFIATAQQLKLTDLADSPLGYGGGYYWKGAAIFNDATLWCAHTAVDDSNISANVTEYGARPSAAQRLDGWTVNPTLGSVDSGDTAMGILLGASAMTIGTGRNLVFKEQFDNFEEVQELAAIMIQSEVRNETYDLLGKLQDNISGAALTAGDFYENTSSLVFATRSPYNA
jgi:hypothetical protein